MSEELLPAAVCMMARAGGREGDLRQGDQLGAGSEGPHEPLSVGMARESMAGGLLVLVRGGREGKAERASWPQTCEVTLGKRLDEPLALM